MAYLVKTRDGLYVRETRTTFPLERKQSKAQRYSRRRAHEIAFTLGANVVRLMPRKPKLAPPEAHEALDRLYADTFECPGCAKLSVPCSNHGVRS